MKKKTYNEYVHICSHFLAERRNETRLKTKSRNMSAVNNTLWEIILLERPLTVTNN